MDFNFIRRIRERMHEDCNSVIEAEREHKDRLRERYVKMLDLFVFNQPLCGKCEHPFSRHWWESTWWGVRSCHDCNCVDYERGPANIRDRGREMEEKVMDEKIWGRHNG